MVTRGCFIRCTFFPAFEKQPPGPTIARENLLRREIVHCRNVSDISPIPSFRRSRLMFNCCGDVGAWTSKIKDFHDLGWTPDFCILTTKSPFGCSFEIIVSKLPLSSEIRTACIGEGTGGKSFA